MAENPNRVTAFFPTKKPGMFVGSVTGQDLENFIGTIKEAKRTTGIVTLFLWTSDRPDAKVVATLNAVVGQPRQQNSPQQRRPIGGAPARQDAAPAPTANPMAGIFGQKAPRENTVDNAAPPDDGGW